MNKIWVERGPRSTVLHLPDVEAHVDYDGGFWILFDSRNFVRDYMRKSEGLTAQVQEHWRNYQRRINPKHQESWLTYLNQWINVHPVYHWNKKPVYPHGREKWEAGQHQWGNTSSFGDDCWLGDTFEYTHFFTGGEGGGEEGAIFMWHLGGDIRGNYTEPEVWLGDFEGFMNEQSYCEWFDTEGFVTWNRIFDGGFMWALKEMGTFDDPKVDMNPVVYRAIAYDPLLAIKPVDIGVLKNEQLWPHDVVQAVKNYGAQHARR